MLKSPFKFLAFKGFDKKPKPTPYNDGPGRTKGKLRKVKHPANTTVDRPLGSERKESGKHYQNQPTASMPIDQDSETAGGPPDIHSTDALHHDTTSPHTQAHETSHLSSSIFEDQSRDFSEGGRKPRDQAPTSGDTNRSPIPSVRRDSFGGGNSLTHILDNDHVGVQDWINLGLEYIPKLLMAPESLNADLPQHDTQEQPEPVKQANQQQSNKIQSSNVTRESPLEEEENRARRDNLSEYDQRERSKRASKSKSPRHGDQIKNGFEPEVYYYIVPTGLDIIFQDEDGTEITRLGKTMKGTQDHSSHIRTKNVPIVVQDIFGNEIFRSKRDQGSLADSNFVEQLPSPNHTAWKTIIVDEKGNQIPLKYAERGV